MDDRRILFIHVDKVKLIVLFSVSSIIVKQQYNEVFIGYIKLEYLLCKS